MLQKFQEHILNNFPFLKGRKLLLATSGGIDSMVMIKLFIELKENIALAHCNFNLRAEESSRDQKFVEGFAKKKQIPFYTISFDTKSYAKKNKTSIQLAARELRYTWFYEILENNTFDYIITAHHADDAIETFLINLSRGTGIDGLTGIPKQNEKVLRPLLPFSREEIEKYAQTNRIKWVEDSSNDSNKYLRNKIRHDIVPLLKEINPDFLSAFQKTQSFLQETKEMAQDAAHFLYKKIVEKKGEDIFLDGIQLKNHSNYKTYLFYWLKEYGFTAWEDISEIIDAQSGTQIFSKNFRLIKDRRFLILSPILSNSLKKEYFIDESVTFLESPIQLSLKNAKNITIVKNNSIFVDANKLSFPLILRKPKIGDSFQPLGMKGKSKKLSKFFKDEKLSLLDKERVWVLCSKDQIVWVVGMRQDERFKIEKPNLNILQISLL